MEKGYVQVYTGDGKGKTTAALGLGLRAVGRGYRVKMYQFLKGCYSGEMTSVTPLNGSFEIIKLAASEKFFFAIGQEEKDAIKDKLQEEMNQVMQVLWQEACDLLIMDGIMAACHAGLLSTDEIIKLIDHKPNGMELVLTGRSAPKEILNKADLVTKMCCIKHYLDQGVKARPGIEY